MRDTQGDLNVSLLQNLEETDSSRKGEKRMLTIELPGDCGYLSDMLLCEPGLPNFVGYRTGLKSVIQT